MVTPLQVEALKYLILKSRDGNDLVKRILFFLIEKSNGLTEQVCVTLTQDQDGYTEDEINHTAHSFDAIEASGCSTHLVELMKLAGSKFVSSIHYGHHTEDGKFSTEGMFPGLGKQAPGHENDRDDMPLRYTFWLAEKHFDHSREVKQLATPSREELMAIRLESNLYPRY